MKVILKKIREVFSELGPDEAKIELTKYHDELNNLHGPEWVAFKTELKSFLKISESDLKEIKNIQPVRFVENNWMIALDKDKEGNIKTGIKNCSIVIDHHPELLGGIKYNNFLQRICFTKNMPFMKDVKLKEGDFVQFDDHKLSQLNKWVAHEVQQFAKSDIIDSLTDTALENNFNPLSEKLISFNMEWDGKNRLDTWLFDYCNAFTHEGVESEKEKRYIRKVGAMWMISAVARAFEAGCKVDTMLILEGVQGKGKSSFIGDLSLGYFLELTTSFSRTKEVVDLMLGKWIIELPELQALSGDSNANKAFLTRPSDKERLSYDRFGKDFPRRCVFIGTTNEDRYLRDITGNRRFWPVRVGKTDRDKLKEDIAQLWGEAVERYSSGERWWLDENDEEDKEVIETSLEIQGMKQDYDEAADDLEMFLEGMKEVRSSFVWSSFFKGSPDKFGLNEQKRVGKALRTCGWKRTTKKKDGRSEKVWVPA